MKTIRRIHLFLGCFFAPLLVVFALTGVLQTFELHESTKDGSYVAPRWLEVAASLHKHSTLSKAVPSPAMRVFVTFMALALVITMILGVVLAFRSVRNVWSVAACLVMGVVVPLVLLALSSPGGR